MASGPEFCRAFLNREAQQEGKGWVLAGDTFLFLAYYETRPTLVKTLK